MAVPSGRPSWHPGRTWPEGQRSLGPGRVCNPVIPLPDGSLQIRPTLKAIPPENQRGPQTEKVQALAVGSPGGVQPRRPPARSRLEPRAAALATYVGGERIPGGSDLPPPLSIILYISRRHTYKQVEILHPTAPFYT